MQSELECSPGRSNIFPCGSAGMRATAKQNCKASQAEAAVHTHVRWKSEANSLLDLRKGLWQLVIIQGEFCAQQSPQARTEVLLFSRFRPASFDL